MFKLQLSVSTKKTVSKKEAEKLTTFDVKDFEVDNDVLKELFTTRLYSTNQWKDGKCSNRNYIRMSGITLDIDDKVSIEEAKKIFAPYNYIIHTSTSHRKDDPRKGGVCDRYRVILPFAPEDYEKLDSQELAKAAYAFMMKKHSFVDGACGDPGRKYFPFLNTTYPHLFEMHINDVGNYFALTSDDLKEVFTKSVGEAKESGEADLYKIHLTDSVLLPDRNTKILIKDIKAKTPCYCNFCDDLNSSGASAFVDFGYNNLPFLHCSHCKKTYKLDLLDAHPELFFLGNNIMRVMTMEEISIDRMAGPYLSDLNNEVRKNFEHQLSKQRNFATDQFRMNRLVDAYADEDRWEMDSKSGHLNIYYAPIPVMVQDNEYVNRWLKDIFGVYADDMKLWMAVWSHKNYQPLPLLIFNGARGVGKSTFGECLQSIYPGLVSNWNADHDQFTDYHEKKLLLIEEGEGDKRDRYVTIKAITGADMLEVNKKFMSKYRVKNNINVVFLTNNYTPMYLNPNERPRGPEDNQFFMYTFPNNPRAINSSIKHELRERMGYFLRTELRELYEAWEASPMKRQCRYGIPCPITDFLSQQYDDAKSHVDYAADEVYGALCNGIEVLDRNKNLIEKLGPYDIVSAPELKKVLSALDLDVRNIKTIRERLQQFGFLERSHKIKKAGQDAWKVIPFQNKSTEE